VRLPAQVRGPSDASTKTQPANSVESLEPVYLDNHLLVVVKPPGLLSQADETGDADLLSIWKAYLKQRFAKKGGVFLGLVHRIDRPASGLLVLARTSKAASRLSEQFKQRAVEKDYVAVVEGRPSVEGPLVDYLQKQDRRVRIVSAAEPGALYARLDLSIRGGDSLNSLVTVRLHTGRPHQIRVQLASRGTPIVGDFKYGAKTELDGKNLALHAHHLSFEHPVRRISMEFDAPLPANWPPSFRSFWT